MEQAKGSYLEKVKYRLDCPTMLSRVVGGVGAGYHRSDENPHKYPEIKLL